MIADLLSEDCLLQMLCLASKPNGSPGEIIFQRILTLMSGFSLVEFLNMTSSTHLIVNTIVNGNCTSLPSCPFLSLLI